MVKSPSVGVGTPIVEVCPQAAIAIDNGKKQQTSKMKRDMTAPRRKQEYLS
jgi:hypothetical protein